MTARRTGTPPRNFALVQALRGIAASWVVLFHIEAGHHIDTVRRLLPPVFSALLFTAGHYGVSVFFALSGFVIAHSLRDADASAAFVGRFLLRRSIRLDPPYWASMALAMLVAFASARIKHEAYAPPSPGQIGVHMLYLQNLLGVPAISIVYWTLTYEVQFYIFFVLMLAIARAGGDWVGRAIWPCMWLLAMVAALGLVGRFPPGLFVDRWHDFFVGAIAYRAAWHPGARLPFGLLAAVMLAIGPWGADEHFARMAALTAVLLFAAAVTGRAEHGLDRPWLQYLGAISYSLYLTHNQAIGTVSFVTHRLLGAGVVGESVGLVLIVAATLGLATLLWATVERATHRWSRAVRLGAPTPALPGSVRAVDPREAEISGQRQP